MFELVVGDDGLRCTGKTTNDERQDGRFNGAPGGWRVGVPPPGSAAFVTEGEGGYHFGEALVVFEEADDEVGGRVNRPGGDEVDSSGREIVYREGRTILDRPGGSGLREEAAV